MSLSPLEQEYFDVACGTVPEVFRSSESEREEFVAMAKQAAKTHQAADDLLDMAFLDHANTDTADWPGLLARDYGTHRQKGETTANLITRMRLVPTGVIRAEVLQAVQDILTRDSVTGAIGCVELARDAAFLGRWGKAQNAIPTVRFVYGGYTGCGPTLFSGWEQTSPGRWQNGTLGPTYFSSTPCDGVTPADGDLFLSWHAGLSNVESPKGGLYKVIDCGEHIVGEDHVMSYPVVQRMAEFSSAIQFHEGLIIKVTEGLLYGDKYLRMTIAPEIVGTSPMEWEVLTETPTLPALGGTFSNGRFTPASGFPFPPYFANISGAITRATIQISGAANSANNGSFLVLGLDGNAAILQNPLMVAGTDTQCYWSVTRYDVHSQPIDGFAKTFIGRGHRLWRAPRNPHQAMSGIIIILPYGTSADTAKACREIVRQKKAGGIWLSVERRTSP